MTVAHINRIGTAVPPHDVHAAFLDLGRTLLPDDKARFVFDRMAERSGIAHRFSFFKPGLPGSADVDAAGFYRRGAFPGTAARMAAYADHAVELAMEAVEALGPDGVTHLVVASCTGFTAPGLDQLIARRMGLSPSPSGTVTGNADTGRRLAATGIGGPPTWRANTNSVSSAPAFPSARERGRR